MSNEDPGQALSLASDRLRISLEQAELALRNLRWGVNGEAPFKVDGQDLVLSFRKHGGSDQAAWRIVFWRMGKEDDRQPLINGSRQVRIGAAHALSALLESMRENLDGTRARTDAAQAAVEEFLTKLDNEEGGDAPSGPEP